MFIALTVVIFTGATACFSQQKKPAAVQASTAPRAVSVNWSGAHPAQIADPAYGMTAYTVQVPNGWKFIGTILRPGGCHPAPFAAAGLTYTSLSPDGVTAYMELPGTTWSWTSTGQSMTGPKCAAIDINSASGFLLNIAIPNLHPDAKIVGIVPVKQAMQDALHQQLENAQTQNNAMARSYGQKPQHLILDAAQVRIEYQENGRDVEELLTSVIDCTESQTIAMYASPSRQQRSCSSRGTIIKRAPKGYLDTLIAQTPPTLAINPAWDSRVIQDMKTGFAQMQKASNDNFNAMMANMKAAGDARTRQAENFRAQQQTSFEHAMQNDRDRQAAIDKSAHQMALFALDKQTFVNPDTGQKIEASSQYNHQWISSDGQTLIQNQDPTFDPNGVVYPIKQSWTELIPSN